MNSIQIITNLFYITSFYFSIEKICFLRFSLKTCEKIISFLHSILAVFLSLNVLSTEYNFNTFFQTEMTSLNMPIFVYYDSYTSDKSNILLLLSSGYFIYDLYTTTLRCRGLVYIIHCIVCGGFITLSLFSQSHHFFALSFLLYELSTPFLNIRYFLKNKKCEKIKTLNDIIFLLSFFISRILWGTVMSYYTIKLLIIYLPINSSWMYVLILSISCYLNYFWFYKIINTTKTKLNINIQHSI